jgi:hypothetical protein
MECTHLHAVLADHGPRPRLHHIEAEWQAPDDRPQRVEQVLKARWPHQQQLALTPPQPVRLEDSWQAEDVIAACDRLVDIDPREEPNEAPPGIAALLAKKKSKEGS